MSYGYVRGQGQKECSEPANYCFPMFMTLFRFHNSTEHGGFECTFLIYQALYHAIWPFSRQTPHSHKSAHGRNEKMYHFKLRHRGTSRSCDACYPQMGLGRFIDIVDVYSKRSPLNIGVPHKGIKMGYNDCVNLLAGGTNGPIMQHWHSQQHSVNPIHITSNQGEIHDIEVQEYSQKHTKYPRIVMIMSGYLRISVPI